MSKKSRNLKETTMKTRERIARYYVKRERDESGELVPTDAMIMMSDGIERTFDSWHQVVEFCVMNGFEQPSEEPDEILQMWTLKLAGEGHDPLEKIETPFAANH